MIVLLCGLSGAGKTTLAKNIYSKLSERAIAAEIIDGDEYRSSIFKDLRYTKEDRYENIRRLGFIANKFSAHGIVTIVSAINPYEEIRRELAETYPDVRVIHIDCPVEKLMIRDTKGLYKRSMLPASHPDKLFNLTGVNDQFDIPVDPDLYINTDIYDIEESANVLLDFIINNISCDKKYSRVEINTMHG
jgi:adenylylsulfate kinase